MTGTTARRPRPSSASAAAVAVAVALAAVVAAVGVVLVGYAIGAIEGFAPDPVYLTVLSVIGVLVGLVGWVLIRHFASRPAAVLRVVVPLVVILSFVPDVVLFGFTVIGIGFMVMHVVVAVPAVVAFRRVLPV